MLKDLFGKTKYVTVKTRDKKKDKREQKEVIPDNRLWTKCKNCNEIIFNKKLLENLNVCPKCSYNFRLTARERTEMTLDDGSFKEFAEDLYSVDPLQFPNYVERLKKYKEKTDLNEAVVVGEGTIMGFPIVLGVMDFHFMGGSMGSVVGEKITLAIEKSIETRKPLLLFSTAGGARMQEGMYSLMQMAKTSAAVKRLHNTGVLFISIMTDPTSGGVTASFASLADIIIAEEGAFIGFAGPRVIRQTIGTDLPKGFQRAKFLLEHGMLDMVVNRHKLRDELIKILRIHQTGVSSNAQ